MTSALHSPLSISNSPLPSGYKQTEVGVIPEEWETQSGEQLTTLIGKGASPRWQGFEYSNRGMLFVTSENVRDGFLDVREPKYLPLAFHEKLKRTKLQKHDILINLVGASIGRSCQLLQDLGEANVNQAVAMFRVKGEICSEFIACCFQAPTTINRILEMQVDAARPNVSLSDLRQFLIPLPPLPEQRVIATALSDVDALLGALDRLIAKKRDLKQAAMQQLLTGQTRLPGFHGEWEVKRLGDILTVRHGKSQHGITAPDGKYPILASGGEIGRTNAYIYDKPSVLIGRKGTIDSPQYVDSPFWTVDTLFFTEISSEADAKFVFYKFTMIRWRSYNEASGVPSLNAKTIENIEVKLPSDLPEQTAIAAVLTEMDAELAVLEQRLAKTRSLKQGMMQELLTGRTRLVSREAAKTAKGEKPQS